MKGSNGSRCLHWQVLATVTAFGLLAWTFREVELDSVGLLLARVSAAGALLVVLPQLLSQALECIGWKLSLRAKGLRLLPLLRVRLATEAPAACLPAGVLISESLKLPLLVRHCSLNAAGAAAAIAARKYLLLTSQGVYIALAAVLGWASLSLASVGVLGFPGLATLLLACGLVVFSAGFGVRVLLSRGRLAMRLKTSLRCLPIPRLSALLDRHAAAFVETDGCLRKFFGLSHSREVLATACFFAGWLFEALETYFILRLLGVELDFFTVASFEVALSFLRSVVFLIPAGLGIQDSGYVLFLAALGVPDAVSAGAAFVLLKRCKELLWAGVGFSLLALEFDGSGARSQRRIVTSGEVPPLASSSS